MRKKSSSEWLLRSAVIGFGEWSVYEDGSVNLWIGDYGGTLTSEEIDDLFRLVLGQPLKDKTIKVKYFPKRRKR